MSVSDDVLPGFEAEAAALAEAKRQARIAERKRAMVPLMGDVDRSGHRTLYRSRSYMDGDGVMHRAVTVVLSPEEWRVLTLAVLAERALAPLDEAS